MLSSADIKRQIIDEAKNSSIRKKMERLPEGMSEGDQLEIGKALEAVTKMAGWGLIEQYMLARMNLVGMVMSEKTNEMKKGAAAGFIEMMQWIHLSIKQKNEIQERINNETKTVSKNKGE